MRRATGKLTLAPLLIAAAAFAQDPNFAGAVYPMLERAQCRGCHASDGVASGTRLKFPETEAARAQVDAFGLSLADLVDRTNPAQSVLVQKPANRSKHTGGERIKQGSDDEKLLTEWARRLARLSNEEIAAARKAAASAVAETGQLIRRLTHSQYNNTVRDLLGDFSRVADRFPPEDYVNGFKNQLRTQGVPPLLAEVYSTAAEKLALNAFRAGDVNHIIPCTSTDVKCRDQFIRTFGERAFRRPLTDAEVKRYTTLFAAQKTFLEGARTTVEAMLQSPKFLFHMESGPGGRFKDYEIASRLSYFFWDTMPDDGLRKAAASGELRTAQGIERAARRLMEDERARAALDEFFAQWLRFDRVLTTIKERRRFPEFTPELAASAVEETRRLLGHLVWNNGNFMEAFTAGYGFLNTDLAKIYNLPAPGGEFEMVRFPAGAQRAGLLGHTSILAATAGPAETSPTARGIFVREHLLCQHVPNPPPGVNTTLPEPSEDRPTTMRQRMAAHAENPSCAGCHRLMDPIGFGLEHFDGIGRWRDKQAIDFRSRRVELDLDTTGDVAGIPNSSFSDARQLGSLLAQSAVCQECIVRQLFRYTFGRMERPADQPTIQSAFAAFRDSGFKFKELMLAMVRAPQFLEGIDRKSK